jgi:pimeloyl-ACP methyl ester carboxylesterase
MAGIDPVTLFAHVFDPVTVAKCRVALGRDADLTRYTTDDAVLDVDDVLTALGYERVSVYGVSYGTRMAQAFMRRFPSRVRSAVLDGVVPFDSMPLSMAASARRALDQVWAACDQDTRCRNAHPNISADFDRLLHRFDVGAVQTTFAAAGRSITVPFTRGVFGYAIRDLLYQANTVRQLPDMVARALETNDLSPFASAYWDGRAATDKGVNFGLYLSVVCSEDVPFPSDIEISAATTGTFLGRYLFDEYRAACSEWPHAPLAVDARTPVTARVPTLLVSGAFDPVTPPAFAARVAKALPISLAITAPTASHGAALGCPRDAVLYVLEKGTLDGVPPVCR